MISSVYFFTMISIILCLGLFIGPVHAETLNQLAVTRPRYGETINVGVPYTLKWIPDNGVSTVNLVLRSGSPDSLATEYFIAKNITNVGEYVWSAPFSTHKNYPLSLMIEDSKNASVVNYSPFFVVLDSGLYLPLKQFNELVDQKKQSFSQRGEQMLHESSNATLHLSSSSGHNSLLSSIFNTATRRASYSQMSKELSSTSQNSSYGSRRNTERARSSLLKTKESLSGTKPYSFTLPAKSSTTVVSTIPAKKSSDTSSNSQRTFRVLLQEINPTMDRKYEGVATLPIDNLDEAIPSYVSGIGHHEDKWDSNRTSTLIASNTVSSGKSSISSSKILKTKNAALKRELPLKLAYLIYYML